MKELAVVLASGGLDSCVTAAIAAEKYNLAFLHLNYGQRTQRRELKAFHAQADHYQVSHRLVADLTHLSQIGGSSLTDTQIPVTDADLEHQGIPTSYVPFRNANILSVGASWAEVLRATHLFIGAVYEDATGYPDCRPQFYDAFNNVIDIGTRPQTRIQIETPIIHLAKNEIIQQGLNRKAPLHLTWSCYQREDKACGTCDSCGFRLRGFEQAGIDDPLPYAKRPHY